MRDLGGDTRVTFLSSRLTLPYRRWGQGGVYMALQVRGGHVAVEQQEREPHRDSPGMGAVTAG